MCVRFEKFVTAHESIDDVDFDHLPDWICQPLMDMTSPGVPLCECCLLKAALHRHGDGNLLTGFATARVSDEEAVIIGTNDLAALRGLSADLKCGVRLLGYYVSGVGYLFGLTADPTLNVFDTQKQFFADAV